MTHAMSAQHPSNCASMDSNVVTIDDCHCRLLTVNIRDASTCRQVLLPADDKANVYAWGTNQNSDPKVWYTSTPPSVESHGL